MKIAIATSTRADWGLLSPVAANLRQMPGIEVGIIAANMHFDKSRGDTMQEIADDGFDISASIDATPKDGTRLEMAGTMGRTLSLSAQIFDTMKPDIVLLLGDRYEIHSIASAAAAMQIPIAHISGGEITEGAIDDSLRHSISKLSSLHFATTESHRQRLIAMGEDPSRVFNVGALGVENVTALDPMPLDEINSSLGFEIGPDTVIVTFHPATNDPADPALRFSELLAALDRRPHLSPLFTYPNNDAGGEALIGMIEDYVKSHRNSHAVPSLGKRRYLSLLRHAKAVIGNSSSGIVEVPSAGIPTVDIGIRQMRRTAAESVLHCGNTAEEIGAAIDMALSPSFRAKATMAPNPYYKPDTARQIAEIIASTRPGTLLPKRFHDVEHDQNNQQKTAEQ